MDHRFEEILEEVCGHQSEIDPKTLEQVIMLAVEIAREGREGRKIGTLFVVGDEQEVLRRSRSLILDPLFGHDPRVKHLEDANLRETVKELAQLDGAFIVTDTGVVLSACRYINASAEGISLPLGLGSRHVAGASISYQTHSVAVVVSESSVVRVFSRGRMITEIIPELWMLRRYGLLAGVTHYTRDMAIVSADQ